MNICRGCPGLLTGDCGTCFASREDEEREVWEIENGGRREDED